jgi:HD-GYP domain-containing protein (c-di-GMP phosphodiesterase class II)
MLAALASALAARDPSTAAHCSRVTFLAARLATWIGWDDARLQGLIRGGPVHDIGKVMISASILSKHGPLRPEELAVIRTHPAAGARLIGPVWPAQEALPYVLYHHERWDGLGYPDGLAGEGIQRVARFAAVADAYDAMTADRPHRTAMSPADAWQAVVDGAGTAFDPGVVEAFQAVVARHPLGTDVPLPDGRVGVVSDVDLAAPLNPTVRVYEGSSVVELRAELASA